MTDLSVEGSKALEAVDTIGYLIRRFATIKDREVGEHLVRDLATIRSALVAREYSKQREEKLVVALNREELESRRLASLADDGERQQEKLQRALQPFADIEIYVDDGTPISVCVPIKNIKDAQAALAENGDTDPGRLGHRRPGA